MDFKDFLKRTSFGGCKTPGGYKTLLSINVEDLGNWAWREIEENIIYFQRGLDKIRYIKKQDKKQEELEFAEEETFQAYYDYLNFEEGTEEFFLKEIAVACLGKKEIEKRLKELKKWI